MSTDDSPEWEVVVYDREGFPGALLEDEEGPLNVSASENEEKPKFYRLDRFLSSSSIFLLRHITSPIDSKQRHKLHQCPGYLREEITLTSDVSKSVIVSHAFPIDSQFEVCSICGRLVQYNHTELSQYIFKTCYSRPCL